MIDDIKAYMNYRNQKYPDGKSALDFAVTEIGEVMDAWLRDHPNEWARNNPDKEKNLGHELGDAYQMLQIASWELTGKSLESNLREKWASKGFDGNKWQPI